MHFDLIKLKVDSQFICLCSSSLSDDLIQLWNVIIFLLVNSITLGANDNDITYDT